MPFSHSYPFDPTCGYSQDELEQIKAPLNEPTDFDAFWSETYRTVEDLPLKPRWEKDSYPDPRWTCKRLFLQTLGGVGFGCWVFEPATIRWRIFKNVGKIRRAVVYAHGYGGRKKPVWPPPFSDAVHVYVCAPGFALSASPDIPNIASLHVLQGIEDKSSYVIRACTAVFWTVSRFIELQYPNVAGRILFSGTSFGGGLGALMLPWDSRYQKAHLVVPTFGHHPERLRHPGEGSGEAIREYSKHHENVMEVLAYYDAATAAKRIKIPVMVCPAAFDPAVAPPGQYAVANSLSGETRVFRFSAGHFAYKAHLREYREMDRQFKEWFNN